MTSLQDSIFRKMDLIITAGRRFLLSQFQSVFGVHTHKVCSIRAQLTEGTEDIAIQRAYQKKLELVFSGGNRNPAFTPELSSGTSLSNTALKKFHGLASYLTAKSTISDVPFVSRFNLGNGLKFHNEGKVTFNHKWYNLNTQDLMPTWRWWITDQKRCSRRNFYLFIR